MRAALVALCLVSGGAGVTALTPATPAGATAGGGTWSPPPRAYGMGTAFDVPVTAADGTVLRADVYYPTAPCGKSSCAAPPSSRRGGFPVLLQQTPYGKQNVEQGGSGFATDVPAMVGQGYVVVLADVRGTGRSGGTWGLFDPVQATDGATLTRWAADELSTSGGGRLGMRRGITTSVPGLQVNGQVGLFGASYMGINEFLTVAALDADGGPNPVRAMFPVITGNDLYRDVVTEGGLFNIEFSAAYLALLDGLGTASPALDPLEALSFGAAQGDVHPVTTAQALAGFPALAADHAGQVDRFDVPTVTNVETGGDEAYDAGEGFADVRAVGDAPGVTGADTTPGQPAAAGYWAVRNPVNVLRQVVRDHIPAFLVGGWHDLFQRGELLNYTGLQNAWYDATTGAKQLVTGPMLPGQPATPRYQLLMGPWTHLTAGAGSDIAGIELEWFASWLSGPAHDGRTPVAHTTTPLHLYQLGSGEWNAKQHTGSWFDTADWPVSLAGGRGYAGTKLYLGGSGSLGTAVPSGAGGDPVRFVGLSDPCSLNSDQWGGGALSEGEANGGSSAAWPCDRNDTAFGTGPGALTYTTGPLASSAVIAGPIDVTLFATSTTPDTELVTDVEEVSPSGQSVPLTTGALLGSLRAVDGRRTWPAGNGAPLLPFHLFTADSRRPVTPGRLTQFDVEVFPTFAVVPSGWRIRVTITTADTPHVLPTLVQAPNLLGGSYQVWHGGQYPSFVNLPLVTASSFRTPCSAAVCM